MNSILITGANRGLGLGLVKCINKLPTPPKYIFATCRNIEQAEELQKLTQQYSNIHILQIDLKNFEQYDNIVKQVESLVKNDGLNVLFNNAGVSPKSTRINFTKADDLIASFYTNTVAPIMLTKALLPLIKKAAYKNSSAPMGISKAAVINMSSILGSIQSNIEGGLYGYRVTKSGLNAATKSMSIDFKGDQILCISMHPGWVKTDMGGSKAPLDVETSCTGILNTLLGLNEQHNGQFLQYNGKLLPW